MRAYVEGAGGAGGGDGSFCGGWGLVRSSITASERRLNAKPREGVSRGGEAGGVGVWVWVCRRGRAAGSEGKRVGGGTRERVAVLEPEAVSADETTVVDGGGQWQQQLDKARAGACSLELRGRWIK
ncbi:hypothetical protein FS749_003710 [Ceratobasidium sp. UAMH 11750]|nr:hypothetical protein FS749_003710 [Ceratobasidium sp. UAMH 11750]